MIAVDTSALVAIALGEPERETLIGVLDATEAALVSAASYVETANVLASRAGFSNWGQVDRFLALTGVTVVPFDAEQGRIAFEAFLRFGKGRGQPARLNLGDCFAYAIARSLDAPLLFKGGDFAATDLRPAA